MWEIVKEHRVTSELIVCEGEGHGVWTVYLLPDGLTKLTPFPYFRFQTKKRN